MTSSFEDIRLYHITPVDRLASIASDGFLWSDAEVRRRQSPGTTVGMQKLKERRLQSPLSSHPNLRVGGCVPFYFGPRSVMLYLLHKGNREGVTYQGGQRPIVHLVARLTEVVAWAEEEGLKWAFTLSNAASGYFEDRADLASLEEIDWDAVRAREWSGPGARLGVKERKQAEFLVENRLAWSLIRGIGVFDLAVGGEVGRCLPEGAHRPEVKVYRKWYY